MSNSEITRRHLLKYSAVAAAAVPAIAVFGSAAAASADATPTSMAQLTAALSGALPTKYRPCVPVPSDKLIHISVGYVDGEIVPAPGDPTTSLCGEAAVVNGATIAPNFVICATCWAGFLAAKS